MKTKTLICDTADLSQKEHVDVNTFWQQGEQK